MLRRGRAAWKIRFLAVFSWAIIFMGVPREASAGDFSKESEQVANEIFGAEFYIPLPEESGVEIPVANPNGTNTASTENAKGHILGGRKVIFYKILSWGEVETDIEEFRERVAETLGDERGWKNAGLEFREVREGQDVNVILSDARNLEATSGCSGDLSCTTFNNEVIINDLRWREGTEASRAAGMEQRDYQHMVVNHEMGHWLGHYQHEERCVAGGPAPVMLQQSTGLRGCDSFNAWPLEMEWWTLR